jgi:oligopeptide/dipeptide ABC transporter ATP-binding protein
VELASTDEMMKNLCHPYTLKLFSSVPGKQAIGQTDGTGSSERAKEKWATTPATGCLYADQCSVEQPHCCQAIPELREVRKGHWVACFRV